MLERRRAGIGLGLGKPVQAQVGRQCQIARVDRIGDAVHLVSDPISENLGRAFLQKDFEDVRLPNLCYNRDDES